MENICQDKDEPWSVILASNSFEVQSKYHITLQVIPIQLVFNHDMILNTPFIADWEVIRRRKQHLIVKNNEDKNKNSKPHIYKVREKVLVMFSPEGLL